VTSRTVVCEKHFASQFIIREDSVRREDGTILTVRRKRPKLTKDAYPMLFPNTPAYLSTEPPRKRKAPEQRRDEQSLRDEEDFKSWLIDDQIKSFDDFRIGVDDFVKKCNDRKWTTSRDMDCVCVYSINVNDIPELVVAVKIMSDLKVIVYCNGKIVGSTRLHFVLGESCKLACWSQLTTILSCFSEDASQVPYTVGCVIPC